jgi:hypothetical protein
MRNSGKYMCFQRFSGGRGRTPTGDPLLRRQMLYATELRAPGLTMVAPDESLSDRSIGVVSVPME